MALRRIEPNDPITFFYRGSELELSRSFDCSCGADGCLGRIRGGYYLGREQMQWALAKGYCTTFMAAQFKRLLATG